MYIIAFVSKPGKEGARGGGGRGEEGIYVKRRHAELLGHSFSSNLSWRQVQSTKTFLYSNQDCVGGHVVSCKDLHSFRFSSQD